MQVLAVFPQKEILDTATFALESKIPALVLRAQNNKDALQLFSENQKSLDVVVIDGGEATLTAFVTLLKAQPSQVPFIICLRGQPKNQISLKGLNVLGVADYDRLVDDLCALLANVKPKQVLTRLDDESKFSRIGTNLLVKLSPLGSGVYIRLSAKHFVKIFQQGDQFTADDLKRYAQQKKIDHMYLRNEDTGVFLQKFNALLKQYLDSGQVDVRAASELVEDSLDTVQELVSQIGVTEEVQELITNNVALSMKVMGDFPELKGLLDRMHLERTKYISSHSMMVAHLACAIAVSMDWYSDSTFQKLTTAAFMHDVALKSHDLCAVKSLQDLEKKFKGKFSLKEVQEYKAHPQRGSALVAQLKDLGAEVDKVILQHHEHPLGSGFPDALNASYITPLASLFIVAHDLVDYAYENDGKIDMEKFIVENETKLSTGHFKKVLKGLLKLTV